jgi:hypothetical protein
MNFFFVKIYLQDVNTHTSVPDITKLFLVNQFTCRTLAVRRVTVLPGQVMGGTAVKKWHKRKYTAAEGYEIRGECVWVVYVDISYIGEVNPVRCSPQ